MIGKAANDTLLKVALLAQPQWQDYAAYCRARESGLRRVAFSHLSAFITSIKAASADHQRGFVNWICERVLENLSAAL